MAEAHVTAEDQSDRNWQDNTENNEGALSQCSQKNGLAPSQVYNKSILMFIIQTNGFFQRIVN